MSETVWMRNRYEQVIRIPCEEMKKRITDLVCLIREKECDGLLVLDGTWEGYTHWITGSRMVETAYISEDGTVLAVYERDSFGICREDVNYKHIRFCREEELYRKLSGEGRNGRLRLGLVQPEAMRRKMLKRLEEDFTDLEFVDVSGRLDILKAVKSPRELELIAETNRVLEQIMEALPSIIRPGKRIREINCETRYLGEQLGGGGEKSLYYAMQYGPDNGSPLRYALGLGDEADARVQIGDRLFMMLEANAEGGLFSAIGRNFILGEPCEQTKRYWEMVLKVQDFAASMMKPGVRLKEIYEANHAFIREQGFLTNRQNYLHSFGYVFGERPYLHDRSEEETLQKGMHMILHPHIRIDRGKDTGKVPYDEYYSVDTYYVSDEGGIRANRTPRELMLLPV